MLYICNMEKEIKKYQELNEIQQLKVKKVLMYRKLNEKVENITVVVLEDGMLRYVFVDKKMIDIT